MSEKILNSKSRSSVGGLSSLGDTNGTLGISIEISDEVVNDGTTPIELKDPKVSSVELMEERNFKNSVEGIEGELLIEQDVKITFEVDVNGDLIIHEDINEIDGYEINNNAELIFNHIQ